MNKSKHVFTLLDVEQYLNLPCQVYLKNPQGIYLECNEHQTKCLGQNSSKEVVGTGDRDYLSPNDYQKINQLDHEVFFNNSPKVITEVVSINNAAPRSFLSYKFPFQSLVGKPMGVFGISVPLDVTHLESISDNIKHTTTIPPIQTDKFKLYHQQILENDNLEIDNKKLSNRERECLYYLIQGASAKEIARILALSSRTIEFYFIRMRTKFNCANRMELATKAIQCFSAITNEPPEIGSVDH